MTHGRSLPIAGVLSIACALGNASPLQAQGIEITPFGGYRFGGDFFELIAGRPVDTDGAPAIGAMVDVPLRDGLQVEGLFTHQDAHVEMESAPSARCGARKSPSITFRVVHSRSIRMAACVRLRQACLA